MVISLHMMDNNGVDNHYG